MGKKRGIIDKEEGVLSKKPEPLVSGMSDAEVYHRMQKDPIFFVQVMY